MNKRYTLAIILLLFVASMYFVEVTDTLAHENAHKQIAKYNVGCKNYTQEINYITLGGSFNCTKKNEDLPPEYYQQRILLDSLNEIVGYNMATIANSLILVGLMISLAIVLK